MEIIKQGDMSRIFKAKIFICHYYGCEFKASSTEYQYSGMQHNQSYYKCNCPTCGRVVYAEG